MPAFFNRTFLIILGALVIIGLGIGWYQQRKVVDWKRSYENDTKEPFGTFLLHEQMGALYPDAEVETVRSTVFDHLVYQPDREGLYFFVNNELPFYPESSRELLDFVARGNDVFIATKGIPLELEDALGVQGVSLGLNKILGDFLNSESHDSTELVLTNASDKKYNFPERDAGTYWETGKRQTIEVLGTNVNRRPNWVKVSYGEGHFWLHSQPNLFSNYYLMDPVRREYLQEVLGGIQVRDTVIWDEYYKVANLRWRNQNRDDNDEDQPSLLAYMFQQPALAWSLGIAMLTFLLFALSESRRRQRIIPPMEPPRNSTLDFTETIGQLYYQGGDHRQIALKRSKILLARIHRSYFLDTRQLDEEFEKTLAAKSGVPQIEVSELLRLFKRLEQLEEIGEDELSQVNQAIESFYEKAALERS